MRFQAKLALVAATLASLSITAWAGDRMGNGGDIRRYRAAWAIRYVKETTAFSDEVMRSPNQYPAGCSVAADLERADHPSFTKLENFLSAATYEWNADPGLTRCTQVFGAASGHPRFVFSYTRCPLELAPQQIVYFILDEAGASLGLSPDASDRFAHFGNMLRAPNCLGVPPDTIPGDHFFDLGEFESPGGFVRRLRRIQARLVSAPGDWIKLDPTKKFGSWNDFIAGAGLDPARLPQGDVLAEIKAWDVRPVGKLPQCSQTELKRFAPIEVSPADCGEIRDEEEFQWLLLHETAHHFGYDDEASADRFAQAFSDLNILATPIIRIRH